MIVKGTVSFEYSNSLIALKKLEELPKHIKIGGCVGIEGSGITEDYMRQHHPNIVFY